MIMTVDFDGTLSRADVQKYVKRLIFHGHDVFILTSRYDDLHAHNYPINPQNADLYNVASACYIPLHRVIFMNMRSKYEYLFNSIVDIHIENDNVEIEEILHHTKTNCIDVNKKDWFKNLEILLRQDNRIQNLNEPINED